MHWNKTSINSKQSKFDFLISRYHKKCYADFVNDRNIKAAKNSLDQTSSDKEPFNYILKSLRKEEYKIWTSIKCSRHTDQRAALRQTAHVSSTGSKNI